MSDLSAGSTMLRRDATADTQASGIEDQDSDLLPSAGHSSGLSPAIREQLRGQAQATGGDVEPIVSDLRARIAEIDNQSLPDDSPERTQAQAERALYVAQVSYLEDDLAVHGVEASGGVSREWEAPEARGVDRTAGSAPSGSQRSRVRIYDTTR